MRMGKTFFLTAAAVLLSLFVCACGNAGQAGNGSPAAKTEESTAEVSPQTPEQESAESQDEKVQETAEAQAENVQEPAESQDENVQDPAEVQAGAEMQETAEAQADAEMQEDADMQAAADLQKNTDDPEGITELQEKADSAVPAEPEQEPEETPAAPTLLYMGQGSLRIVTGEGRVIYIDPYSGDGYDLPADLILVTHGHFDHNGLDLIQSRNEDCRIITQNEAIADGEHQSFDLEYVRVEAVEAGYNQNHDVRSCVGYVLTFSNGRSVYVTGDTSTTQQMPLLAEKEIDYAFFCCDGVYNMDAAEASECAKMVAAKHNLPYHTSAKNDGINFDRDVAEQFEADNRIILAPGEEIALE